MLNFDAFRFYFKKPKHYIQDWETAASKLVDKNSELKWKLYTVY